MIYSFLCPPPCDQEIRVEAKTSLDAVDKLLKAGAMRCRNSETRCTCEKARIRLNPMPQEQLQHLVGLCMRELENPPVPVAPGQANPRQLAATGR